MLEVNGGNDYKIRHMGKLVLYVNLDIYQEPLQQQMRLFRLCKCSVVDGGKISDVGDDNSDAGAGDDGTIDQMILPIAAV